MVFPRRNRPFPRLAFAGVVIGVLASGICGCSREPLPYSEPKALDEKINDEELAEFLRIVEALPEGKLPAMPPAFAPPPAWDGSRTLPVGELVDEELHALDERWNVEWQARQLEEYRPLLRILRRAEMTTEQFVGLTLALGAALGRDLLAENVDLEQVAAEGRKEVAELQQDERPFHTLSPAGRHFVLRRAMWLSRKDRAERMELVPPENLALVRRHRDELLKIFPAEYRTDPLAAVADRLAEQGVPFEELAESGRDDEIEWSRTNSIVGHDAPDPEFQREP